MLPIKRARINHDGHEGIHCGLLKRVINASSSDFWIILCRMDKITIRVTDKISKITVPFVLPLVSHEKSHVPELYGWHGKESQVSFNTKAQRL